jgi:hypothetical protein
LSARSCRCRPSPVIGCLIEACPPQSGVTQSPHQVRLAGPTNHYLAEPGSGALISLHQVTTALLLSDDSPTLDTLTYLCALAQLVDEANEAFAAAERQSEEDERAFWSQDGPDQP